MSSFSNIPVTEAINQLANTNGHATPTHANTNAIGNGGGNASLPPVTNTPASVVNSVNPALSSLPASLSLKAGLAQMLKGGVIMDVTNASEARIAEECGAVAVMALERVPSDIRRDGGVARMSNPKMIQEIQAAVSIPVMAKARIGHFVEAQILQALNVDYVDESEVLTPADETYHINKHDFSIPFVCGCRNLGEALRRIQEGAAMIRTKGEAGTGNIVEAVRHARTVNSEIRRLTSMDKSELFHYAKEIGASYALVEATANLGRLPVVQFAAGGIATPADAALMMQLGMDGVFVGSGIFKSADPKAMGSAIVQAVTHFRNPKILAQVSGEVGEAMKGLEIIPGKITLFAQRESGEPYTQQEKQTKYA